MGRPPTGQQPRLSIRMDREALRVANERARVAGTTVGRWLEEAIREKVERRTGVNNQEMSLRKMATILGVSQPFLSQIRAGKRPMPNALRTKVEALGAYH